MTRKPINNIIESYMTDEASEEVRAAFDKWLTDAEYGAEKDETLKDIWENMPLTSASAVEDPFSIIEEAEKIANIESQKSSRRKTAWLWLTSVAAACMAVLAFVGWSRPEHDETCLVSSVNSKGEFVLPDGSTVWLNKDSRLYYLNDLQGEVREVRLEGEGYFDVARDAEHPFVVRAGEMSIKVLGTRFTVSAYKDRSVEAYLEEGKIMAKVPECEPIILTPDQAVRYDASAGDLKIFDETASDHTAWIDGKLEFVNKSLKDIIDCLEHWYCVSISCNDMAMASKVRLSMTIRQEGIEEICKALSTIADLSYFIDSRGNVKISFNK